MQVLQNCCSMITGSPLVWQEYNYNLRKSDEDRTFSTVLLQHSWTHYSMMKLLARDKISHIIPGYWQGSGNLSLGTMNVYTQFPRPGLYKPVFLNLHKNHLLTPSLGPPKTYWCGIYHDVQVTYVTFIHSYLITTGIRSGVLCIDISCIRYIWRGKPGDMKL